MATRRHSVRQNDLLIVISFARQFVCLLVAQGIISRQRDERPKPFFRLCRANRRRWLPFRQPDRGSNPPRRLAVCCAAWAGASGSRRRTCHSPHAAAERKSASLTAGLLLVGFQHLQHPMVIPPWCSCSCWNGAEWHKRGHRFARLYRRLFPARSDRQCREYRQYSR